MAINQKNAELAPRIDEFFGFAASRCEAFGIALADLAALLKVAVPTCQHTLRHFAAAQRYKLIESKDLVFIVRIAEERALPVPAWLFAEVQQRARACAEEGALLIDAKPMVSVWRLAPQEFASLLTSADERRAVAAVLDYAGLHKFSHELGTSSLWAAGRLSAQPEVESLPPGIRTQRLAELGLLVLPEPKRPNAVKMVLLTALAWLAVPLIILRLWMIYLRFAGTSVAQAKAWADQAIQNDRHWQVSGSGLHFYLRDMRQATHISLDLALDGVRSPNPVLLLRSLNLFLFFQAHLRFDDAINHLQRLTVWFARRVAPMHLGECLMDRAIVGYACGRFASSLLDYSEANFLWVDGHYPFYELINLSSAIRSGVGFRVPKLSAALATRAQKVPAFSSGPIAARSQLCTMIQWLREDGSQRYHLDMQRLGHVAADSLGLAQSSMLLLLSVALHESGRTAESLVTFAEGVDALAAAGLTYNYRRIVSRLNVYFKMPLSRGQLLRSRFTTAFSAWSRADISGGHTHVTSDALKAQDWDVIAAQFCAASLLERPDTFAVCLAENILAATTFSELAQRTSATMQKWLPEFRFQIEGGNGLDIRSQAQLPATEREAVRSGPSAPDSQVVRAYTGISSGVYEWRYFAATVPEINLSIVLGTRAMEERPEVGRLTLAHQIVALFSQAATFIFLRETAVRLSQSSAVAATMQMFAHDVRKPFSILRMGVGMLNNAKDPAGVKLILGRLVPEIDKAVSSVDGLIADVMEVGATSSDVVREPIGPAAMLLEATEAIFRVYPKAQVNLEYELQHQHLVSANGQKMARVFANIIGNAVQATAQKGKLWFATTESAEWTQFAIGNSGSLIPAASMAKLFDPFFTSGKKGGTGLGLTIAAKVVHAHGGKIWCESGRSDLYPDGYVVFKFTLPVATPRVLEEQAMKLPAHSQDVVKALLAAVEVSASFGSISRDEVELEAAVVQAARSLGRPVNVLIVDDEEVYRLSIAASFARTSELAASVQVHDAAGSTQALDQMRAVAFDLIITDVDMGAESLSGFDLVRTLRAMARSPAASALTCVHSNRIIAEDHRTAIECGADAFISKPAARGQLLKLVLQAASALTRRSAI